VKSGSTTPDNLETFACHHLANHEDGKCLQSTNSRSFKKDDDVFFENFADMTKMIGIESLNAEVGSIDEARKENLNGTSGEDREQDADCHRQSNEH
jgi:hypothetical protein